uniref:Transporter 1, ATP binding cassette subfamily B member n=1 Tax=Latimeria chalumnae TaxID=7897 RepID=H3B2B9_LATCH
QKMEFAKSVVVLVLLDVVTSHAFAWILGTCLEILEEGSVAGSWVLSLLRCLTLVAFGHWALCHSPGRPCWVREKDIYWYICVLSLLVPVYATLASLGSLQKEEILYNFGSFTVFALTYAVTALVHILWQQVTPLSEEEEESISSQTGATILKLVSCMKPDFWRFVAVAFFVVVSSAGEMAIPYYTGRMTDWIMNEENPSAFFNAIMAMSLITVGSAVTEFICDCVYNYTMSKIHMRIQSLVFRSVVQQDIAFFDTVHTGDITSRITTDTNTMSESLSEELSLLMWYFMRVACLYTVMLRSSWKLSLLTAIGLPIIMVIPKLSGTFYQNLTFQVQESLAKANDVAVETFSSMKTVRSFANEDGESQRYSEKLQKTYNLNKKEAFAYAGFMWTNNLSSLALKVSILYYGGCLVTSSDVTSGDLVAFVLYELQFTSAIEVLLNVYPHVKKAVGASEKIFEYMDRKPAMSINGGLERLAPDTLPGHIVFNNVSFAYPKRPDTLALKNVSFDLKPGEITALVGPSGGGKSTCVCLLERFYEPQSGEILLDGVPIQEYDHKYLHAKIALVSQEPMLFARSIQENIGYGFKNDSLDSIIKVAQLANAHEFISGLQDGYKTGSPDAGEKGGQLSGGQKQRIAIARALIRKPRILILDDATSSLDTESEHMIQEALFNGTRQQTILVIAHRLSTVENADKIIVLENGEIVEQGTHNTLLQNNGAYYHLIQKQFHGFNKENEEEK